MAATGSLARIRAVYLVHKCLTHRTKLFITGGQYFILADNVADKGTGMDGYWTGTGKGMDGHWTGTGKGMDGYWTGIGKGGKPVTV